MADVAVLESQFQATQRLQNILAVSCPKKIVIHRWTIPFSDDAFIQLTHGCRTISYATYEYSGADKFQAIQS